MTPTGFTVATIRAASRYFTRPLCLLIIANRRKPSIIVANRVRKVAEKKRLFLSDYQDKDGLCSVVVETRRKNHAGKWIRTRVVSGVKVALKNWTGKEGKWVSRNDSTYHRKNLELESLLADEQVLTERLELIPFIESYIDLSAKHREISGRRKKMYVRVLRLLETFSKEKRYPIEYDTMSNRFITMFIKFLRDQGFKQNYIRTLVKALKHFLRVSLVEGHHDNRLFQSDAWNVPEQETESIYLTVEQIAQVSVAQMPNESLELIRDVFVLGCNLGLRYSDLSRLSISNVITFEDRSMIRITQEKTNAPVVIPLNSMVNEIIERHSGFPRFFELETFNKQIKRVCMIARFTKWEKVSSHTMRRSFATNAYLARVPSHSIMKITGHRSEASFLKYIRISREDHARHIGDHPFFS